MKILLDLQGIQTASSMRGIGRYSLSLAEAIVRNAKDHEVLLLLNHAFPEKIESIRESFKSILNPENILVWEGLKNVAACNPANSSRARASELIREHYIQTVKPDVLHISSLFEGWVDDATTSVGSFSNDVVTAVTLYDLIPYLDQGQYLSDPNVREYYLRKIESIQKADLLLAISDSARQEALSALTLPEQKIITISTDTSDKFQELQIPQDCIDHIQGKFGIRGKFIMSTGTITFNEPRKNFNALIEAYTLLDEGLKKAYQLVLAGEISALDRSCLAEFCKKLGLANNEVIFTGYISDEDLVHLYNLAELCVLPSLHEGFGLPALEGMRCGVPVIGSNCSSIPEVIGLSSALFDPKTPLSIANKINEVLTDDHFREVLRKHGESQRKKFSWDETAKKTIQAFEAGQKGQKRHSTRLVPPSQKKKKLAYFSPFPPEQSGISDYSTGLLPALARYYDIELITNLEKIEDTYCEMNFPKRTVEEFCRSAEDFDRILYHIGNSPFHSHMFSLLEKFPGTIVLHDFFLSAVLNYMEFFDEDKTPIFRSALFGSHGYSALKFFHDNEIDLVKWKYPASREIIKEAKGIIVHSKHAIDLATQWYGPKMSESWIKTCLPRRESKQSSKKKSREILEMPKNAFIVCSFGMLDPTKMNETLVKAWLDSELAENEDCYLYFVGSGKSSPYGQKLQDIISNHKNGERVFLVDYVAAELYQHYLVAADIGVQLRTQSRGETSISVLDCFAFKQPVITNSCGSFAEIPACAAYQLKETFAEQDLVVALEEMHSSDKLRTKFSNEGYDYYTQFHTPKTVAKTYFEAIESFEESEVYTLEKKLCDSILSLPESNLGQRDLLDISSAVACNLVPLQKQLFVDVSRLVKENLKTGMERVSASVLRCLLESEPPGYRVEPVYRKNGKYFYAREFTFNYLGIPNIGLEDEILEIGQNDVFLGLDWDAEIDDQAVNFLQFHSERGMEIYFVVCDLLPAIHPEWFPPFMEGVYTGWLGKITSLADGFISISKSVSHDLNDWIEKHNLKKIKNIKLAHFHLGADVESDNFDGDPNQEEVDLISSLYDFDTILMVGTVEPRKGHKQVLGAMEKLWAEGSQAKLVIVGKKGWDQEDFYLELQNHLELNKRLLWFPTATDEVLLNLYKSSTVLLMASYGEGFGLPLIEAAHHELPIIARDIPVFREIAGSHAYYFSAKDSQGLAKEIQDWFSLYKRKKHPKSQRMPYLTWMQSTQQLLEGIFEGPPLEQNLKAA